MTDDINVVIVGGGIGGLLQARWLLQHLPETSSITLLEREHDFGGVWDVGREYGVMECTVCNVSKECMELVEHPWPPNTPAYPHHSQVLSYIRGYAMSFVRGTRVRVVFGASVRRITPRVDGGGSGYEVEYGESGCVVASHVVIANGHSAVPHYPLCDMELGRGVTHSCGYKSWSQLGLQRKRVLVVGLSFSGVDVVCDLVKGDNHVTMLSRRGTWFAPKTDSKGTASDLTVPRFFTFLPHVIQSTVLKLKLNHGYFNQARWEVKNTGCDPVAGSLVSSPEFVGLVRSGDVGVVHGSLEGLERRDKNGEVVVTVTIDGVDREFDHVVFCTGYKVKMEFFDEEMKESIYGDENHANLFLNMIPPRFENLSFIGLFNVRFTSPFQVMELQAYYNALLISGKVTKPSRVTMETAITRHINYLRNSCKTFRGSLFLESDYRNTLITMINSDRSWFPRMLLSPKTMFQYYCGPMVWSSNFLYDKDYGKVAREEFDKVCEGVWGSRWVYAFYFVSLVLLGIPIALLVACFYHV